MTVCGIKTRSDDLKTANMTGIESEPGIIDGVDFDTGAGGGRNPATRRIDFCREQHWAFVR